MNIKKNFALFAICLVPFTYSLSSIHRQLSRCKQLGGLVPVFRMGVPPRHKASKLCYKCGTLSIHALFLNVHACSTKWQNLGDIMRAIGKRD